jgi:hypothetical protein
MKASTSRTEADLMKRQTWVTVGSRTFSEPNRGLGELVTNQLAEVATGAWEGVGRADQHTTEAPPLFLEDILVWDFGAVAVAFSSRK